MERNGIGLSVLFALLAAIIGGAVWALIAVLADYEIGLVAWAIGLMAGYAVIYGAKGPVTQIHQIIAVVASLLGILIGKYFSFGHWFTEGTGSMLDPLILEYFITYFTELFGMMDIIFVLLAIITAWQIPGKHSEAASQAPEQEQEQDI